MLHVREKSNPVSKRDASIEMVNPAWRVGGVIGEDNIQKPDAGPTRPRTVTQSVRLVTDAQAKKDRSFILAIAGALLFAMVAMTLSSYWVINTRTISAQTGVMTTTDENGSAVGSTPLLDASNHQQRQSGRSPKAIS